MVITYFRKEYKWQGSAKQYSCKNRSWAAQCYAVHQTQFCNVLFVQNSRGEVTDTQRGTQELSADLDNCNVEDTDATDACTENVLEQLQNIRILCGK